MYPQLENSLKCFDMNSIAVSKTLATCKILVPSVGAHLIRL